MHRTAALLVASLSAFTASGAAAQGNAPPEAVAWVECLHAYGERHVASDVSVETIATAAIGYCRDHDQATLATRMRRPTALRFVLGPLTRAEREDIREDHERLREEFKERLIGDLVEKRAGFEPLSPSVN